MSYLFWDNINKKIFKLKELECKDKKEIEILKMFLTNPEKFKMLVEDEIEIKEEEEKEEKTLKELIKENDKTKLRSFFVQLNERIYNTFYLSSSLNVPDIELLTLLVEKAKDEDFYYKLRSFNVRDVFFPFDNILKYGQWQALLTNVAFDEVMFKMIILNEKFGFKIKMDYFWYYNFIFQILKTKSETFGFSILKNLIEFDYFVKLYYSSCYQIFPFKINFVNFEGKIYKVNKEKKDYSFIIEFQIDSYGKISETRLLALNKISNKLITEGSCHPNAWGSTKFCWGNVSNPGYITKDFMFSMVSSINFDSPATKMEAILPEFRNFYKKIVEKILKQGGE